MATEATLPQTFGNPLDALVELRRPVHKGKLLKIIVGSKFYTVHELTLAEVRAHKRWLASIVGIPEGT